MGCGVTREKQTRMKRGSETQRLLTVSVLDLLNTVLEDFRTGGIFNLGDKTFHVDDNFPGVGPPIDFRISVSVALRQATSVAKISGFADVVKSTLLIFSPDF